MPTAEPTEGMAHEVLIDGGISGVPKGDTTSLPHPAEDRARNRSQAQASRSEQSRSYGRGCNGRAPRAAEAQDQWVPPFLH
jgi:hypothetical protein